MPLNIGALIIACTILRVPYQYYSIMGPKTHNIYIYIDVKFAAELRMRPMQT